MFVISLCQNNNTIFHNSIVDKSIMNLHGDITWECKKKHDNRLLSEPVLLNVSYNKLEGQLSNIKIMYDATLIFLTPSNHPNAKEFIIFCKAFRRYMVNST